MPCGTLATSLVPTWTPCSSDATREVCRESARLRQARKPFQPACGRLARSARRCTPRPSRRFAKRTVEQCVLAFPGTIAFLPPHVVEDCTVFTSFTRAHACFCDLLLDCSGLFGLTFRSCLSMPQGNVCHAGGWHLRRKLRVALLLRLPSCLFGRRCAQMNSDSSRRISLQGLLTHGVLFFFAKLVFFTHCAVHCCQKNVHSFLSSIMSSGYAWIRSNVISSWCLHRHPIDQRSYTMLHALFWSPRLR